MRRQAILIGSVLCGALVVGCGQGRTKAPVSAAELVVAAAVDDYGGLDRLSRISTVRAYALVTTYDERGGAHVCGQQLTIRPRAGRIESAGLLPGGSWRAKVSLDGGGGVSTSGRARLSESEKVGITQYLRLILHRVRGPMNLLGGGERPDRLDRVFVATLPLDRVLAAGRPELASAYFFDPATRELRLVTVGDYVAPGSGTVTSFRNARLDNGIMLPTWMEVVNLGANSFVGDRKILTVQFTDVQTD